MEPVATIHSITWNPTSQLHNIFIVETAVRSLPKYIPRMLLRMRVQDEKKRQDGETKSVHSQQYLTCPTYLAFLSLTVQYDPA